MAANREQDRLSVRQAIDAAEVGGPPYAGLLVGFAGLSALALLLGISPWAHWRFVLTIALTLCAVMLAQGRSTWGAIGIGAVVGLLWVVCEAWRGGRPSFIDFFVPVAGYVVLLLVLHHVMILRAGSSVADWMAPPSASGAKGPAPRRAERAVRSARSFLNAFEPWHRDWADQSEPWKAFDCFLREQFLERLGAKRVRCFHVLDSDRRVPLSESNGPTGLGVMRDPRWGPGGHDESDAQATRRAAKTRTGSNGGIEGHVVATGQAYVHGSPEAGPYVEELASRSTNKVVWCFPIRRGDCIVGLVRVGYLPRSVRRDPSQLELFAELVTLCWCRVFDVHELGIARRIDGSSGVLARSDFLSVATRAMRESMTAHEPFVVMVLALEGMRSLDAGTQWAERDRCIQRVGAVLDRKLRSDDVIGRFSDDRFVALLRRVDQRLGRLITENLRQAVVDVLREDSDDATEATQGGASETSASALLAVRCALVGRPWHADSAGNRSQESSRAQAILHELIADVFARLDAARLRGEPIGADAGEAPPERAAPIPAGPTPPVAVAASDHAGPSS